jgi:hypothetical protein
MTDDKDYIINPRTNRKLRVGSMHYKKYIADQQEEKLKEEPQPVVEDSKSDLNNQIIETAKTVLQDIATKNKKKLTKSADPETELRKMLYEKLCIAKKKKKTKPNSRYKFYVSESESDKSESSDDSE